VAQEVGGIFAERTEFNHRKGNAHHENGCHSPCVYVFRVRRFNSAIKPANLGIFVE